MQPSLQALPLPNTQFQLPRRPLDVASTCSVHGLQQSLVGQPRDATRAPIQARNGWRPSGRLLVTPPHHLTSGQILSNLWGPPQSEADPHKTLCGESRTLRDDCVGYLNKRLEHLVPT